MQLRIPLRIVGGLMLVCVFLVGTVWTTSLFIVIHGRSGNAQLPADCAMVFGAAVRAIRNERGNVVAEDAGPGIARRVATAVELWKQGDIQRFFFSGGTGEGMGRSEAEVMKEYAMELGVPSSLIEIEDQSHSTNENLRNTRNLTEDCSSIVGISDGYHLSRIRFLAWQQGWKLQTYPAKKQPDRVFELSSILRESFALIYYAILA
jgi:uncharacterized SAM-binding protein YcdF (DUF218 family)